jgi:hypothetical protein
MVFFILDTDTAFISVIPGGNKRRVVFRYQSRPEAKGINSLSTPLDKKKVIK